jgi:hypothetical protein
VCESGIWAQGSGDLRVRIVDEGRDVVMEKSQEKEERLIKGGGN